MIPVYYHVRHLYWEIKCAIYSFTFLKFKKYYQHCYNHGYFYCNIIVILSARIARHINNKLRYDLKYVSVTQGKNIKEKKVDINDFQHLW